ncbi:baseplate J/gp47 family protein [Burkholderia gladioli]|uniref:baseplate J/gp47 family protein n=1 Tax=Burkholderia gladioli TaxID=28095 RepID=UPI003EE05CE3
MANLSTQSFATIVQNFATAVQGAASQLIDFTVGSVLLAIAEATGGVALWLQGLVLQVLALTRASTSTGADLDSWFAQFGFARLPADAATTQETFSRFTPTNQALVEVGDIVQTADGTVQFAVVADTTNPAYSAAQGGYVIPAGQASVSVTVQCTVAGTIGNVSAGALNTLGTAIPGVDFVSNSLAVQNGVDAESDAAARARFVLWVAAIGGATLAAVKAAANSVALNVKSTILENQQYNGQPQNGYFTVITDDGTGDPPSSTLDAVGAAVEVARPLCSTYSVHGPQDVTANVTMAITTTGVTHATAVEQVTAALSSYIEGLGDGVSLPYTILASIAYGVAGVTNVTGVLLNGGTSDLIVSNTQRILPGTITVD